MGDRESDRHGTGDGDRRRRRDGSALSGLTVFVTGGSRGIGREIARTVAAAGADVAVAARSDGVYETAESLPADATVLPVETDVTDEASVRSAIDETVETLGGLDCLVNNAGIAGPTAPIEEVTVEEWDRTMAVNVRGMFLTIKHAASALRASERGSIINVASISGKRPLVHRTPYTSSKMAVVGLTRTVAVEFGDDDVTANAICPGATTGPRIDRVIEEQADRLGIGFEAAKRETFTDDTALGTLVDPGDVADLVVFLASDRGRHVTAQDINVDAGSVWY
jgi:NAD(P)-dependent dehydrogenase (short-subunit alcohol dehydrogenase family)